MLAALLFVLFKVIAGRLELGEGVLPKCSARSLSFLFDVGDMFGQAGQGLRQLVQQVQKMQNLPGPRGCALMQCMSDDFPWSSTPPGSAPDSRRTWRDALCRFLARRLAAQFRLNG